MAKDSLLKPTTEGLSNVQLSQITIMKNFNAKNRCKGDEFDELVESIKAQGVLQPILLRPKDKGYALVAGERRFKAMSKIAKANGGMDENTIPAVIKELTDAQAAEAMLIENIQRKDLTELEEAEGFKKYIKANGESAVQSLSEKTGIKPVYINKRVAVLGLPKEILEAWDDGQLKYGHLEQLIRVPEHDAESHFESILNASSWNKISVNDLKHKIDNRSPELKDARFNTDKAGCGDCKSNSEVQMSLFAMDQENLSCLNKECFTGKTREHLEKYWKQTAVHKKYKTNTVKINGDLGHEEYNCFHSTPKEDCQDCVEFTSIVRLDGSEMYPEVCTGEEKCFNTSGKTDPKDDSAQDEAAAKVKQEKAENRSKNHGIEFREKLFETLLPETIKTIDETDLKAAQLSLIAILSSNSHLHSWFNGLGQDATEEDDDLYRDYLSDNRIVGLVSELDLETCQKHLVEASSRIFMEKNFSAEGRHKISEHVGIDLSEQWVMTKDYLRKKHIPEIRSIIEDFKIMDDEKAQDYLQFTIHKAEKGVQACKKTELIDLIIESEMDLTGMVPDEILKAA